MGTDRAGLVPQGSSAHKSVAGPRDDTTGGNPLEPNGHPQTQCDLGFLGELVSVTRSPVSVTQDLWPAQSDACGSRSRSFPRPRSRAPSAVSAGAGLASPADPHLLGSEPAPSAPDCPVPTALARPPTPRGPRSLGGRLPAQLQDAGRAAGGGGHVT